MSRPAFDHNIHRRGWGRRVVFVHGVGSDLQSWEGVIQHLGSGYECLSYDLRGHGESAKSEGPYSLDMYVDDLLAITDAVGWHRFDLVGFSLGGLVAQSFALKHPGRLRTLSIVSSVAGRTPEEYARVRARADVLATSGASGHLANSVERWFTDEFRQANHDVVQARIERSLSNDPACYAAAYRVLAETDLADQLDEINVPTLVMTGEADTGSTPRMAHLIAKLIPDACCVIFPKLKHSVLLESPALVADELSSFLNRHEVTEPERSVLFHRGLGARRAVLGDDYVDKSLRPPADFAYDFQRLVSEYCWGECWTDPTLSLRERSILNLGMIAALGKMHEFELHLHGALRNGLTKDEIAALLKQIAVYCGIPVGVDCFRIARLVFDNAGESSISNHGS